MICEHGNEVKVVVTPRSSVCWDDGILWYGPDGRDQPEYHDWIEEQPGPARYSDYVRAYSYLLVTGCPFCVTIQATVE